MSIQPKAFVINQLQAKQQRLTANAEYFDHLLKSSESIVGFTINLKHNNQPFSCLLKEDSTSTLVRKNLTQFLADSLLDLDNSIKSIGYEIELLQHGHDKEMMN